MSLENLFSYSVDNTVINHYLHLLAQRNIQLEDQVERLTVALKQRQPNAREFAMLNGQSASRPELPLIIDTPIQPEMMEQLLIYLPAIFPGFWNSVSPEELATLIGATEKPIVPSPYRYPDMSEMITISEQIETLPKYSHYALKKVCHSLQQRYNLVPHRLWLPWLNRNCV